MTPTTRLGALLGSAVGLPGDWDFALASLYRTLMQGRGQVNASGAGTLLVDESGTAAAANAAAAVKVFHLDSADYPAGSKSRVLRVTFMLLTNDTAPAAGTWTAGLYPVTAVAGAAAVTSVTLGAVVSGSTAVITSPAADSMNYAAGADFAFPSAGYYALGLVIQNSMGANASAAARVSLQSRAV